MRAMRTMRDRVRTRCAFSGGFSIAFSSKNVHDVAGSIQIRPHGRPPRPQSVGRPRGPRAFGSQGMAQSGEAVVLVRGFIAKRRFGGRGSPVEEGEPIPR